MFGDALASVLDSWVGRSLARRAIGEMFGPHTKPSEQLLRQFDEILDYNQGRAVTHKVGRFITDRYLHRNRWVRAMREVGVPQRMIDGPSDPNSGRHMADRYRELMPNADVVYLDEGIGHWPQLEAPEAVLQAFLEFHEALPSAAPLQHRRIASATFE